MVSVLAILLPLYLIDQNLDLGQIGIILSLGPFIFLFFRVIFASIADTIGTRKISLFYSLMSFFSVLTYSFSTTPFLFGLGTILEGFRAAGFWSIIRTQTISESHLHQSPNLLIHYANLRQIVDGLGRFIGGLIIVFIGFSNTFTFLMLLSFVILALNFQNNHHQRKSELSPVPFYKKIIEKRSKSFWFSSFLQILVWIPFNVVSYFLLPIYLKTNLNYSIEQTGFFVALFLSLIGVVSIVAQKIKVGLRSLFALSFLIAIGFFLFIVTSSPILPILVLAIGMGASNILAEYLLSKSITHSKEVSTDIGLMFVPLKLVEFLVYLCSGFVISSFGYSPIFILCSISILAFLFFSKKHFLNSNESF